MARSLASIAQRRHEEAGPALRALQIEERAGAAASTPTSSQRRIVLNGLGGEVAELALIRLRRDGAAVPHACLPALVQSAHAALLRHPAPSHRTSWSGAADAIEEHLARALLAAPRPVHLVGYQSGDAIFELLPLHADLRRQDREMLQNSVRFAICGVFEKMTPGGCCRARDLAPGSRPRPGGPARALTEGAAREGSPCRAPLAGAAGSASGQLGAGATHPWSAKYGSSCSATVAAACLAAVAILACHSGEIAP
jgi:hypothetical protein